MEAPITLTGVLITVGVAALSFLASQTWDIGKTLYRERKLRKALRKEIEEASPWLRRNLITFKCMIQLSCVHALANNGPVPIPVLVHAEHYPDIVLKLSTEEKALVTGIYNILYRLNKNAETILELNPQCLEDEDKLQQLRSILDTAYRNTRKALLLIDLYGQNVRNLKALEADLTANDPTHKIEEENDQELLKLAGEAQLIGEKAIRKKYHDGAVSPLDVAPTAPPVAGRFYFDITGAKYKCLSVQDEMVEMIQLESQIGVVTYDLHVKRPISSFRHLYELKDQDETARLERRFLALRPRPGF
ncbi:MAG TPA: hypothetical protein VOA88_01260 [Candidatus Dormibacteraeota bacterium]|nr:hypothetical protein [Candidatus Dormibacteraeota bacterium]